MLSIVSSNQFDLFWYWSSMSGSRDVSRRRTLGSSCGRGSEISETSSAILLFIGGQGERLPRLLLLLVLRAESSRCMIACPLRTVAVVPAFDIDPPLLLSSCIFLPLGVDRIRPMFQLNLDYETCLFDKHACEEFENGFERRSQVFPLDLARFPTNTSHRQRVFASIIVTIASDLLHKPLPSSIICTRSCQATMRRSSV